MIVLKPGQEYDELGKRKTQIIAKIIYFLYCAIDSNKYSCVCQRESTKEIWRLLEITYKGTNQVLKSLKLIYILDHSYELFSINDNKTIFGMFTRFIDIVNSLQTLGKTYKESKKVMKILRSFPKNEKPRSPQFKR